MLLFTTKPGKITPVARIQSEWSGPKSWIPLPMTARTAISHAAQVVNSLKIGPPIECHKNAVERMGSLFVRVTIPLHGAELQIQLDHSLKGYHWHLPNGKLPHGLSRNYLDSLGITITREWLAMMQQIDPRVWTATLRAITLYDIGGIIIGNGPIAYFPDPGPEDNEIYLLFELLRVGGTAPVLTRQKLSAGLEEAIIGGCVETLTELKSDIEDAVSKKYRPHQRRVMTLLARLKRTAWMPHAEPIDKLYGEIADLQEKLLQYH